MSISGKEFTFHVYFKDIGLHNSFLNIVINLLYKSTLFAK